MKTNKFTDAVISIWIPKQGSVRQGKFCYIDNKPTFIANMSSAKWFKNFGGYAISTRILKSLPRGTIIAYKRIDLGQYYLTNKTRFQKKGILGSWGGHSQWCLPLKNWKAISGKLENEPRDLPVVNLEDWKKPAYSKTYSLYDLKKEFEAKYIRA